MDQYEALKYYFGHSQFRQGQEALIDAILSGRDVLGIMPTGGGKSLCYQIPALVFDGVTLVISPLISLMKDQVAALSEAGIQAAYLNSTLTVQQMELVYQRARAGAYQLLYVAPERLDTAEFSALMAEISVPLVAVDEAHCISQWGQDFQLLEHRRLRPAPAKASCGGGLHRHRYGGGAGGHRAAIGAAGAFAHCDRIRPTQPVL